MRYINWRQVKSVVPLLIVITIILDVLLLRYIKPTPPLEIVFWLGVYVIGTFLVLFAIYLIWTLLSGVAHTGVETSDEYNHN